MTYSLRLDESRAAENPYDLHFEGSLKETNLASSGLSLRQTSYPIRGWDMEAPLLRGPWHFMSQVVSAEEVASFPAPPQNTVSVNESTDPMNWTDVLAWTLSAASIGVGLYLVKDAYGTGHANQNGLGVGLATAGSTWAGIEIMNRILDGKRPKPRGALLALALGSGTTIGLAAKFTTPPPLLDPSAFQDQQSLNAKNPVSEWGP